MVKFEVKDTFVIKGRGVVLTGELETPLNAHELNALKEVEIGGRVYSVRGVERHLPGEECKQTKAGILI